MIADEGSRNGVGQITDVPPRREETGEDWTEPIPLESDRSDFPLSALPAWMEDLVVSISESVRTPVDIAAGFLLGVLALVVQRVASVRITDTHVEPTNLYVLVVAEPGVGKSPVVNFLKRPLLEYEHDTGIRILYDDITMEALTPRLAEKPAILSTEGNIFTNLAGLYTGNIPNITAVTKAHDGDAIWVDRVGRKSERIDAALLTMAIASQPQVLGQIGRNSAFKGQGLLARLNYILPKPMSKPATLVSVDQTVLDEYASRIRHLLEYGQKRGIPDVHILDLDAEAQAQWLEYRTTLDASIAIGGRLNHMPDWGNKLAPRIVRIAGILHVAENLYGDPPWCDVPISKKTMRNAGLISKYLSSHAISAYEVFDADAEVSHAQQILEWIQAKRVMRFTVREVYTALRGRTHFKKVKAFVDPLRVLEEHHYIREEGRDKTKQGRPPSTSYLVNPWIMQNWK